MISQNTNVHTDEMSQLWKLHLVTTQHNAQAVSEQLEDFALSTAWFDSNSGTDSWQCEALFDQKPDIIWLKKLLLDINYTLAPLEVRNWIEENQAAFPPLEIGDFYIHGSHITPPQHTHKIIFEIDAATAFGTGEHATTQGCLLLIEHLYQQQNQFKRILDLGCGTGILGMAASALFKGASVILADNDLEAINVTQTNIEKNNLKGRIDILLSEGFENHMLSQHIPFDLIIANILAAPLITLAPDIFKNCATNGYVILSGLLVTQIDQVLNCYNNSGFKIEKQKCMGDWAALLLKKS